MEKHPKNKEALCNLGVALYSEGDVTAALRHFHTALRVDPAFPDPLFNLGQVLLQIGRTTEAEKNFKRFLALERFSPFANLAKKALGTPLTSEAAAPDADDFKKQGLEALAEKPLERKRRFLTPNVRIEIGETSAAGLTRVLMISHRKPDTLSLLHASPGFKSVLQNGVAIGDSFEKVDEAYPMSYIENRTPAKTWRFYRQHNLVFEFSAGRVVAWYSVRSK